MARVNLETKLWGEFAFQELVAKLGDRQKAKGMVCELFTLAQEFWFPDRKLVPLAELKKWGLQACVDVGLAEVRTDGIYVFGSSEAFAWLFQKSEAGKRSGEKRKRKSKRPTPVDTRSTDVNGSQRDGTSLLSSLSSSLSSPALTPSSLVGKAAASPLDGASIRTEIWKSYSLAYEAKHGAAPVRNAKVNSLIKRFSELVPLEEAPRIAAHYVQSNNGFYFQKGHPLELLVADAQKLRTEWVTGRRITQTQAREVDRGEANREVVRGYLEETGGA